MEEGERVLGLAPHSSLLDQSSPHEMGVSGDSKCHQNCWPVPPRTEAQTGPISCFWGEEQLPSNPAPAAIILGSGDQKGNISTGRVSCRRPGDRPGQSSHLPLELWANDLAHTHNQRFCQAAQRNLDLLLTLGFATSSDPLAPLKGLPSISFCSVNKTGKFCPPIWRI